MANKRTYTKVEIEAIKQGLNHYFPYEIGETSGPKVVDDKWSDLNKIFIWMGRDDFFTTLSESTGIQKLSFSGIKNASGILEKMEVGASETAEFKGAEESPVQANRPSKGTLEQMEEENQIKETKRKEITEQSNRDVRAAIEKQKEIYSEQLQKAKVAEAALKDKKIYYEVEKMPVEETQEVKNLKQQAEADPKRFIEDAAKEFGKNPNIKNLTTEEMDLVTKQAGVTSYDVLTDNSPLIQSVVISRAVSDPKFINSIPDVKTRESVKNIADMLTNQKIAQFELSKQFIDFSKIDGYKNASDIKIEFSDTPQPGFKEFNYNDQLTSPHIENLNQQSFLLDSVRDLGEGEIKSRILLGVGKHLESYVGKLPVNSLLARTYNSEIVQLGLSSFGVVPAVPWTAVEGSWIGKIAIGSGYGNVAGFIQAKTGINLGVKLATKAGIETITKAGVTMVAKTGFKAVFSKITAAVASIIPVPVLNWIVGWIGGELLVKIAEKIPWGKIKKFGLAIGSLIIGVPMFIGGLLVGGSALTLGGFGLIAVGAASAGGLTLSGAVGGMFKLIGGVAKASLGAIFIPILGILIGFPLVVALILFIINSGAYIVPPGSMGSAIINIPPGGNLTKCDPNSTGAEITDQLASSINSGSVLFLPNSAPSRQQGLCMTPTMIILHTSSGYDNDDGNIRTYETLVQRRVSCQMATDTNDTILMLSFFEKQVENAWCADNLNAGGVSIEMAGEPDAGFGPFSKCAPTGDQTFTPNGPHPCPKEEDLSFDAICKVMQKYKIPWTQVFQHEASNGSHVDPNGDEWVDKFILRLKNNCQI